MEEEVLQKIKDFQNMMKFREEMSKYVSIKIEPKKGYGKMFLMLRHLQMMREFGYEIDKSDEDFIDDIQKKGYCQVKIIQK